MHRLIVGIVLFLIAFNAQENTLATDGETFDLENIKEINLLYEIETQEISLITDIAYHELSDHVMLRNRGEPNIVELWTVAHDESVPIQVIDLKSDEFIWQAAFSATGRYVALNTEEAIHVWEVGSDRRIHIVDTVYSMAMHPNRDILAYVSPDNNYISIWDLSTSQEIVRISQTRPTNLVFDKTGSVLFVSSDGGGIVEIEFDNSFSVMSTYEVREGKSELVGGIVVLDDVIFYSLQSGLNATIEFWDIEKQEVISSQQSSNSFYIRDGIFLKEIDNGNSVEFWDYHTDEALAKFSERSLWGGISIDSDNSMIALSDEQSVTMHNLQTGDILVAIPCADYCRFAFSSNDQLFFVWNDTSTIQVWGIP